MSNNIDNLLGDIYSSTSQSQGVKELANLINNLSQLLLKAISQLEQRVAKLEQQSGRAPRAVQPSAPSMTTTPAPAPKVASPFSAPKAPKSTPPPPPQTSRVATSKPAPPPAQKSADPASVAEAASMLGVTLKKAPSSTPSTPASSSESSPSFLTTTVNPDAPAATPAATPSAQPDAVAPASTGVAGPAGGFRGELAEKLAKRRQKVQKQIDDDFDAPDLVATTPEEGIVEEPAESTSSELKTDLEDELRSAFSKLKE